MKLLFESRCWLNRFYRQGFLFGKYLRLLETTERYSEGELLEYQNARLQRVIRHCEHHVPYYRNLFRKLKLRSEDFQTVADLKKLPYLDKQTAMAHFDELISRRHQNPGCRAAFTSGTTGTPARFLRDYPSINFENAAAWRQWRRAGDFGKKRVSLRGGIITPVSQMSPPFWRYNPANRELQMSSFHLSFKNSLHYIHRILKFQPEILYCLPSNGLLLARFFRDHGIDYRFDAVFTSSEMLEQETKEELESFFQCRVYDWYGQAERVGAIGQCDQGAYHIQEDYSIVELEPVPGEDNCYELIGTQLYNDVMPLLRYRTQDRVFPAVEPHCACGSAFRKVDRIQGRAGHYLITPEGCKISITAHIPCGVDNLIETQFLQEKPGEVTLHVLTNGQFTERDRAKLIQNTLNYTSPQMKVMVREVPHIPRGPNGKFIGIINKLESEN